MWLKQSLVARLSKKEPHFLRQEFQLSTANHQFAITANSGAAFCVVKFIEKTIIIQRMYNVAEIHIIY